MTLILGENDNKAFVNNEDQAVSMVSQLFEYLEDPTSPPKQGASGHTTIPMVQIANGVVSAAEAISPVADEFAADGPGITASARRPSVLTRQSILSNSQQQPLDVQHFEQMNANPVYSRRRSTLISNQNTQTTSEPRASTRKSSSRLDETSNESNNSVSNGNIRRQDQYISRLFYEEEASDARPADRVIDIWSLSILKKLFHKLKIEDMYQLYSKRQFSVHMTASMVLLAVYKLMVVIMCVAYLAPGIGSEKERNRIACAHKFLIAKSLSHGAMFAISLTFLIGVRLQRIYQQWSAVMSVVFLTIYGIHCLVEPWIEALFYQSIYDPTPNLLHYIFTAYAMLPINTSISIFATIILTVLSVTNQIVIFFVAYQNIEVEAGNGENRQPEESVVNQVISLCLLYLAAIIVGIYLKVFCTELTYRQTFYNTRRFIETELMTSIENEINQSVKEALIHQILPSYLVRDILQQIETLKHFQVSVPNRRSRASRRASSRALRRQSTDIEGPSIIISGIEESGGMVPTESDLSNLLSKEAKLLKLNIQKHTGVTILFADIVKFVILTRTLTPNQLVETLHDLYSRFDHLAGRFNCQRTKLIGDCYKCVSGLNGTGRNSAVDAVSMGLHMALEIGNVASLRSVPQLQMRIGVHSGFVFAGILGLKKWQFDVWSDDVEIANALETEGQPGCVHVSEATVSKLPEGMFTIQRVEQLPNPTIYTIWAYDILTRKSIRSYFVKTGVALDPSGIAIQIMTAQTPQQQRSRHCGTSSIGADGFLSPIKMLPLRIPSMLSENGSVASRQSGSTTGSTGHFRRVRKLAKAIGDVFVTGASGTLPATNETASLPAVGCTPSSDNPIGNFIIGTREFSRQLKMSAEQKEAEINRRMLGIFVDYEFGEIKLEMANIALTFKNLRLERIYKQHRDDKFQLAIVVSYLTFLILTAVIRLNHLEGANQAVTTAISGVTTLLLGFAVFLFTICGFSNKLMIRLRAFLRSNFARSVAYVAAMAVLYCNSFMPFYLCSPLDETGLKDKFPEGRACKICDIECPGNVTNLTRQELRLKYPPIVNFEEAMSMNKKYKNGKDGCCPDAYLFGDMTILLVFVTAVFSRIPFLIRYLVIIIGYLVFLFFAFLLKADAFTVYDLCAVQHHFWSTFVAESKVYYALFQLFFFVNLFVMCYQQEKNNRLDFLLRDGARKKQQELRKKLAQNSALLENILPSHVIQWYIRRANESLAASELYINSHDSVCILFAKITNYTFEGESVEVMRALNEITAAFDNLLDLPEYAGTIEKIKINQTMFMYAAGLDNRDNRKFDEAAITLLEFAAGLFEVLGKLNEQISYPYKLRAGMHYGSVVAGVIGSAMPLYDILGDTVNYASRLEGCLVRKPKGSQDGFIHVSSELNEIYHVECGLDYYRELPVDIKGVGVRNVYLYVPQRVTDFMKGIKQELNKN